MRIARRWSTLVALLALALPTGQAFAATTSASLNGSIVNQTGDALADATVEIVHVPTGTTREATTGDSGAFFQSGLRIGGPYALTIEAPGYEGRRIEDLYLRAGSQQPLRIALRSSGTVVEEMTVTAERLVSGRDLNNGVGSAYTSEDIRNQPSTQRDVIRTLLRDPLAQSDGEGNLSVAGVNPRFNALSIDGSLQQDDFGLGSSTYATSRSPINLDAVESVALLASDYSVEVSGFTGGLVNVNTKSGTNEFDGSLFYYFRDDDYVGDTFDGDRDFSRAEFEEDEYGFTLGGPILKDRLFFFVSYDEFESTSGVDFSAFDANNGIQPGFFEALADVIETSTGYRPLPRPSAGATPETSERTLVKLDANITEQHRASFTYQDTEETGTSVDSDEFEGAWYDIPVELESYTAQLFSDWTPQLSTELRYNYKEFARGQDCRAGTSIGELDINALDAADAVGTPLEGLFDDDDLDLIAGCDRFRHANAFEDERTQFFAKAEYLWGDHVTTVGAEYEEYELFNVFVFGSSGRFIYEGLDELIANTPEVDYRNATSNNASDAAAAWGYDKYTLFAADAWQITQDFELTYGLRYERFVQDDEPVRSAAIASTYGIDTSANLDGKDLILPRVGFRWDLDDATTLSGGFGRFAGGDPKVWTSNAFQPPVASADGVFPGANPASVPQALLDEVGAAAAGVPIDAIGEDFEIPSDWKASIRVDYELDRELFGLEFEDWRFTAQYLYTQVEDGFLWTNLAQTRLVGAQPTGVAPDGRPIYADLQDLGISNLVELDNYDDGESHVITLGFSKRWDFGLDLSMNYAFQDVETVTEGTSSRGISNWRGIAAVDRNDPSPRTAPFEVEHSFKISLGFEREFIPGFRSRFDLFGRIFKDDPFVYSFNVNSGNSLFGRAGDFESPFDNNPLYVPSGPNDPLVVYASEFDQEAFFRYVADKGIGSGIHEVNSEEGGWNQIWDFQFQQELPSIPGLDRVVGENHIRFELNIDNVLNLINDDWGRFTNGPRFGQQAIVGADLVSAADLAANGVDGATALTGDSPRLACATATDCVYRFNDFDADPVSRLSGSSSIYRIRIGIRMDF
jgi:hypothetical protein